MSSPSVEVLNHLLAAEAPHAAPLHTRVRRALRTAIDEHFDDGEKFWPENLLVSELGISQGTVRRALLDLTREGVLQRQAAKGTFVRKHSTRELRAVGVFVPDYNSELYTGLLENIAGECALQEYQLHIYHTHKGERTAEALRQVVHGPQEERFILLANVPRSTWELFEALDDRGCRTVNIGMPIKGYPGTYVGTDDEAGVRLGLEHLASLGHREIVMLVNEPLQNPVIAARQRTFEVLCRELGLEAVVVPCGTQFWQSSYHAAYAAMPQILERVPRPTAIWAASDQGAWGVLKALAEQGIKAPAEISVLGYDDVRPSEFMHPALTSITQPLAQIVSKALELLWDERDEGRHVFLPPTLTRRESTAPRRQEGNESA